MPGKPRFRAAVVVAGDVARSPRMMYHAESLARELADVELIGRVGGRLPSRLETHPHIRCRFLPGGRRKGAVRAIAEFFGLVWLSVTTPERWDLILLQAPPAFPAVWALRIGRRTRGGKLLIDWHNFGPPLMKLRGGISSVVAPLLAHFEKSLARGRDAQFCVSRAMREALLARGARGSVSVFYDRPHRCFQAAEPSERGRLRERLRLGLVGIDEGAPIVVSPTSWTRDEDFGLLLSALRELDGLGGPGRPVVGLVLTGRGDEQSTFEAALRRSPVRRAAVATAWLEADEYFRVLAGADAGLCLHRSASGVDLPMKIADLRGSGLPVLALRSSETLYEVFDPESDGATFESATELAGQLESLSDSRSELASRFSRIRENSRRRAPLSWQDGWEREARPLIEEMVGDRTSR